MRQVFRYFGLYRLCVIVLKNHSIHSSVNNLPYSDELLPPSE